MARYHQNITIDGIDIACENSKRKNSKFWNEGKWHYFIEPLLPKDCDEMTFIEYGCNVGLFLRMAKEKGFNRVIGIEKGKTNCKMAEKYRDSLGLDYRIINKTIGSSFSFDEMPIADYTLLANFHYYLNIEHLLTFLDNLYHKTVYCIIVSRKLKDDGGDWRGGHWIPSGEYENIRNMFREWTEIGAVRTKQSDLKNDPHSRELWSLIFKSNLNRESINGYTTTFSRNSQRTFANQVNQGNIKAKDTEYYKVWKERKGNSWSDEKVEKFVQEKMDIMNDVKKFGLKEPIIIHLNKHIADGNHRKEMLKELGSQTIITRKI